MPSVNAALRAAKPFLDALDVHPATQQQRGEMVPELMHSGAALGLGPVRYPGPPNVLGLPSGDCHGNVISAAGNRSRCAARASAA